MSLLEVRNEADCRYDILSLGEVMLRLDPGEGRIRTARDFRAWEGGGEYNVARGLRRCFNQRAAIVTAFARNDVGMLMEDFILQGGVDTSQAENPSSTTIRAEFSWDTFPQRHAISPCDSIFPGHDFG
jgi:2-dehydro-3-deoxygluconokinase